MPPSGRLSIDGDGTVVMGSLPGGGQSELHAMVFLSVETVLTLWSDLMSERDSRYLTVYTAFTLVSIVGDLSWGCWASNIAFVSDAAHMFFDLFCVVSSLAAMVLVQRQNFRSFSYSYGVERLEVVAGFTNACMLVLVSILLGLDAVHRTIYDDKSHCAEERPLSLPLFTCIVNVLGIFIFWIHYPTEGGIPTARNPGSCTGARLLNLGGVWVHMLSDASESVAAIISTLFATWKGWYWADIVLSVAIGCIVMLSALPILRESALILLQTTPARLHAPLAKSLAQVHLIDGVNGYQDAHFWSNAPSTVIGSIRIQARAECDESVVKACVREAFCGLVQHMTVQVEKPETSIAGGDSPVGHSSRLSIEPRKRSVDSMSTTIHGEQSKDQVAATDIDKLLGHLV